MNKFTYKITRVVWNFRLLFLFIGLGAFSSFTPFNRNQNNSTKFDTSNISLLDGIHASERGFGAALCMFFGGKNHMNTTGLKLAQIRIKQNYNEQYH